MLPHRRVTNQSLSMFLLCSNFKSPSPFQLFLRICPLGRPKAKLQLFKLGSEERKNEAGLNLILSTQSTFPIVELYLQGLFFFQIWVIHSVSQKDLLCRSRALVIFQLGSWLAQLTNTVGPSVQSTPEKGEFLTLWFINQVLSIHSVNNQKRERKKREKERETLLLVFLLQIWRWKLLNK